MPPQSRREKERRKVQYASAKERIDKHETGFTPTTFRVPEGVELFRFKKAGKYRIDVVPYLVGKGNPYADEGFVHYERTYFTHRGLGADNVDLCCLRRNWKENCPVCEKLGLLRADPDSDEELVQSLREKERQLFLFIVHNERDKGVQLFECSHYRGFGELLDKKVKASDAYENFFYLDDGMTLDVMVEEESFKGRPFMMPANIEMFPRKQPLSEDLLDQVPCLDDLLIRVPYKEMKATFLQTQGQPDLKGDMDEAEGGDHEESRRPSRGSRSQREEPEEEQEERPSKRQSSKPDSHGHPTAEEHGINMGDWVEHPDHGLCEVIHISRDGTSLRLKPEDGETVTGVSPDDVELAEAPQEEPEEKSRRGRPSGNGRQEAQQDKPRRGRQEPEEEDDDWDDDDESSEGSEDDGTDEEPPDDPEEEEERPRSRRGRR